MKHHLGTKTKVEVDGMALWVTLFLYKQVLTHFHDYFGECMPLVTPGYTAESALF